MTSDSTVNAGKKRYRTQAASRGKHKPKLGQNFLADAQAAREIVNALGDVSQRTLIEIGPGRGAMTRLLAERALRLIAIEFDRKLTAQLRMDFMTRSNIEIIEADVLSVDFDNLVQGAMTGVSDLSNAPLKKADVIGNLPYYITSDILLKLFAFHHNFSTIVIMVQREVADRICAQPKSRDYGLLTATSLLYATVENLFTLPPEAFSPSPKVHSSVLRLRIAPRFTELGVTKDGIIPFLKLGFALKRKTLLNNLKNNYPAAAIRATLEKANVAADVRAEALSLEQLAAIHLSLLPSKK